MTCWSRHPALVDPNFERSVVLVLDIDEDGALGVILNRPSTVPVGEILPGWSRLAQPPDVLFQGGPVATDSALGVGASTTYGLDPNAEPVGFRRLYDDVGIVDLDTPTEIAGPMLTRLRIFAGYAGWGEEQLRDEIASGSWYVVPSTAGGPVRRRPRGAVDAGAAPAARRARLGVHPAPRPHPELTGSSARSVRLAHREHPDEPRHRDDRGPRASSRPTTATTSGSRTTSRRRSSPRRW